jgi:hypothetical protein
MAQGRLQLMRRASTPEDQFYNGAGLPPPRERGDFLGVESPRLGDVIIV